jgi:hypothetical protein
MLVGIVLAFLVSNSVSKPIVNLTKRLKRWPGEI